MFDQAESFVTPDGRTIGAVMMEMKNITLRFGGVVAIKDISFDVREGEIRAIIGPNGAGKSSMLNVISGFYHPQEGEVWYKGARRPEMKPFEVARQGIARTFRKARYSETSARCLTRHRADVSEYRAFRRHERFRQRYDRPFEPYENWHFKPSNLVRESRT